MEVTLEKDRAGNAGSTDLPNGFKNDGAGLTRFSALAGQNPIGDGIDGATRRRGFVSEDIKNRRHSAQVLGQFWQPANPTCASWRATI